MEKRAEQNAKLTYKIMDQAMPWNPIFVSDNKHKTQEDSGGVWLLIVATPKHEMVVSNHINDRVDLKSKINHPVYGYYLLSMYLISGLGVIQVLFFGGCTEVGKQPAEFLKLILALRKIHYLLVRPRSRHFIVSWILPSFFFFFFFLLRSGRLRSVHMLALQMLASHKACT